MCPHRCSHDMQHKQPGLKFWSTCSNTSLINGSTTNVFSPDQANLVPTGFPEFCLPADSGKSHRRWPPWLLYKPDDSEKFDARVVVITVFSAPPCAPPKHLCASLRLVPLPKVRYSLLEQPFYSFTNIPIDRLWLVNHTWKFCSTWKLVKWKSIYQARNASSSSNCSGGFFPKCFFGCCSWFLGLPRWNTVPSIVAQSPTVSELTNVASIPRYLTWCCTESIFISDWVSGSSFPSVSPVCGSNN